ncbi:Uma2 family endonuclease [Streptomyces sp. UNOB3_S3]|uniref:Uma2 family endonuclease n=1 Tax=Streptomyces sp. UNOB3_S3 TaxID=2871682 RepID=UPI001E46E394|nr:Uma2 family endonuclease [Streptomyces sp. UNOB3_S3]MCC3773936.1 Uma2 family endonuclease [Streptomyces sp. UNOB3_S3]
MTLQLERPVTTEEMQKFEEIDEAFPDLHAEMIDGEVCIETVVTHKHGRAVMAIALQLGANWCVTTEVDTVYEGWRGTTLLRPDLAVSDPSYLDADVDQFPADEIILAVEVTSKSNPKNDTVRKVEKYAQAGVLYYLIVDPVEGKCLLHSLPEQGHYRAFTESEFGIPVSIGAPIDTELNTTAFRTY